MAHAVPAGQRLKIGEKVAWQPLQSSVSARWGSIRWRHHSVGSKKPWAARRPISSAAAAALGTRTQLVSVVGEDFPEQHRQFLAAREADLAGLQVLPGRCFRWTGRYHFDMNRRDTLETQLNVLSEFHPVLPESFRAAEFVFLANVDPVLQLSVLEQVRQPRVTMLDSMNFWIEGAREALTEALSRVDIVLMNEEEVRQYAETPHLLKGARQILALGPKALIVKKGEYGAVLLFGDRYFYCPAYPLEDVKDPDRRRRFLRRGLPRLPRTAR